MRVKLPTLPAAGPGKAIMELPAERLVGRIRWKAQSASASDVLMAEALTKPVQAPFLRQALAPGDHVAMVLDAGLADHAEMLNPIFRELVTANVESKYTTILLVRDRGNRLFEDDAILTRIVEALSPEFRDCTILKHDPGETKELAYLASTNDGRRVYFNRALVDADFVLPIAVAGPDVETGFRGPESTLFPLAADEQSLQRNRLYAMNSGGNLSQLADLKPGSEPAWLLGAMMGISVLTAPDGKPARAWFGMFADVDREARNAALDLSTGSGDVENAQIGVVTLASSGTSASWDSLAIGLSNARRSAPQCEAFVAVAQLDRLPGDTLRYLAEARDYSDRQDRVRSAADSPSADVPSAVLLAEVLSTTRVYLLSDLKPELADSLGFIAVESPADLATLVRKSGRALLFEDADLLWV